MARKRTASMKTYEVSIAVGWAIERATDREPLISIPLNAAPVQVTSALREVFAEK